jgi:hypothetical protein
MGVGQDMRGIEEFAMAQLAQRAPGLVCLQHPGAEQRLVQALFRHPLDVLAHGLFHR